tara:strand:+ start:448 stop:639 length:192 start_codon:yes stop_codon:yes gene_type:complete
VEVTHSVKESQLETFGLEIVVDMIVSLLRKAPQGRCSKIFLSTLKERYERRMNKPSLGNGLKR